ncbi:MAG: hypothetical protein ROZ09_14660 [Thiobacillus sp.]|jgi:hypothetical protein|uniref:hypothetical protein n=1 Tax=Thiobacillus sp. TaxID=924 RepID=UPI0028952C6D|nr:hypothetical protein [Thiobacillus sp.]MDT3708062.1 hypothetical protein [Thiobacillus sp.]
MKWNLLLLPLALALVACDPAPSQQPETGSHSNRVFETQIQAMEKARAVEGQLRDAAEAQHEQIDQAGQP